LTRREANSGSGRAREDNAEKPALCGKTECAKFGKLRLQTALGRGNQIIGGLQESFREGVLGGIEDARLARPVSDKHAWRTRVAAPPQAGRDSA
jgi:hypothetical protein